jgi:nucleoside phosphorylase
MTERVLVVSATRDEARYVPAGVPLLITGLGKVAAAAAVAARLAVVERASDFEVWNIGTAGALRDGVSGLHLPGRVINHDISSNLLASVGIRVEDSLPIAGGDPELVLATGDSFIADPVTRAALAERATLVDMEGFAVAWACRAAGVPIRLVKHVSDNADSTALSWPELIDASARDLGHWVQDQFESID